MSVSWNLTLITRINSLAVNMFIFKYIQEINMSQTKLQIVRKYTRESKSPFQDASTSLWLANVTNEDRLELDFSQYIYVHRDDVGKVVGVSVSKSIAREHSLESKYLEGSVMYRILIFYIDQIIDFCELWADEFEQFFLLPPDLFFELAQWHWNTIIENDG